MDICYFLTDSKRVWKASPSYPSVWEEETHRVGGSLRGLQLKHTSRY